MINFNEQAEIHKLIEEKLQDFKQEIIKKSCEQDKRIIHIVSSEIVSQVKLLLESYTEFDNKTLNIKDEMQLLDSKEKSVLLLINCFAYLTSKRREIGPAIQTLLVAIYDSANDSIHYEKRDDVFKKYGKIIAKISAQAQLIFIDIPIIKDSFNFHKDAFMPWVQGIPAPIRKAAKRYFCDECKSFGNHVVSKVEFKPKTEGVQLGSQVIVNFKDNSLLPITFHMKTHQHYPAKTFKTSDFGTPSGSRRNIDLKELFVYKVLEYIGLGPKVHFMMHQGEEETAFQKNALFIATQDVGYTKFSKKKKTFMQMETLYSYNTRKKEWTKNEEFDLVLQEDLKSSKTTPIKLEATIIDIMARIFRLIDLNDGNFGRVKIGIGSNLRYKWKLIDFEINQLENYIIGNPDSITEGFIKGNGILGYSGVKFLTTVLVDQRMRMEKINLGSNAVKLLEMGRLSSFGKRKMTLKFAINKAFEYIEKYINEELIVKIGSQNEEKEGIKRTRAELLGVKAKDAMQDLRDYRIAVLENFINLNKGLKEKMIQQHIKFTWTVQYGFSKNNERFREDRTSFGVNIPVIFQNIHSFWREREVEIDGSDKNKVHSLYSL